MTPVGHVGIALPVAYMLRLRLPVVFLCALLPDLVDKPLWALGIGGPRYIAHTLLSVFFVAAMFFLWKRAYGSAALLGGLSHLLLDWLAGGSPIPWFYSFVSYRFPHGEFDPSSFLPNLFGSVQKYFTLAEVGQDLMWTALVWVTTFLTLKLFRWYSQERKKGV